MADQHNAKHDFAICQFESQKTNEALVSTSSTLFLKEIEAFYSQCPMPVLWRSYFDIMLGV